MLIVLTATLAFVACSDSDDNPPDGDMDTPPEDGDDDAPEIDLTARDCGGLCQVDDGYYCDVESQTCKMSSCTPCQPDKAEEYCGAGIGCYEYTYDYANSDDTDSYYLCMPACEDGCPSGFECQSYEVGGQSQQLCVPNARCLSTVPMALPGDPCGDGGGGASCFPGDSCLGFYLPTSECKTNADCDQYNLGEGAYCNSDGQCAFGFCATPCLPGERCPEGTHPVPGYPTCICAPCPNGTPVGTSNVGEACGQQCVDNDVDPWDHYCPKDLNCLGNTTDEDCTYHADCYALFPEEYQDVVSCNGGKCAFGFCAAPCLEDGTCEQEDGQPSRFPEQVSGQCFCGTCPFMSPVGTAEPGDLCLDSGNCDGELTDYCTETDSCNTYSYPESSCTNVQDCTDSGYEMGGSGTCSQGKCTVRYCATPCLEGDVCAEGLGRVPGFLCLCAPAPFGEIPLTGPEVASPGVILNMINVADATTGFDLDSTSPGGDADVDNNLSFTANLVNPDLNADMQDGTELIGFRFVDLEKLPGPGQSLRVNLIGYKLTDGDDNPANNYSGNETFTINPDSFTDLGDPKVQMNGILISADTSGNLSFTGMTSVYEFTAEDVGGVTGEIVIQLRQVKIRGDLTVADGKLSIANGVLGGVVPTEYFTEDYSAAWGFTPLPILAEYVDVDLNGDNALDTDTEAPYEDGVSAALIFTGVPAVINDAAARKANPKPMLPQPVK